MKLIINKTTNPKNKSIKDMMMKLLKKSLFTAGIASALITPVYAGEVAQNSVTEFQSGTTAQAAQVNANFDALITAINDNAQRITDLEGLAPSSEVEGHVYRFIELEIGVEGVNGNSEPGSNSRNRVFFWSNGGTLSFSGGIVTINGDQAVEAVVERTTNGVFAETIAEVDSPSGTFTQSGTAVEVAIDGDNFTFHASVDGSVLIARVLDIEPPGTVVGADVNFLVGIRVQ